MSGQHKSNRGRNRGRRGSARMTRDEAVGNITASAIATTEDAKRRESEVMARFGNETVLRLGDKALARQEDPYLRSFTGGEPMYAFERVEFDKQYPQHPLTQIRRLVAHIITNN